MVSMDNHDVSIYLWDTCIRGVRNPQIIQYINYKDVTRCVAVSLFLLPMATTVLASLSCSSFSVCIRNLYFLLSDD